MLLKRTILGSCVVLAVAFGSPAYTQEKLKIDQAEILTLIAGLSAEKGAICRKSRNPSDCNRQYDTLLDGLRELGSAGLRLDEAYASKNVADERKALVEIIRIVGRNKEHTARLRAEYIEPHFKGTRPISLVQ